jgi:large subunit ribosomal protein L31
MERPLPVHVYQKRLRAGPARPGNTAKEPMMKHGIHPNYVETTVTCTCGNSFSTRSTAKNGVIHADVCSACHPFYTGKQKILDTGGRVAKFEKRFGKAGATTPAKPAAKPAPRKLK